MGTNMTADKPLSTQRSAEGTDVVTGALLRPYFIEKIEAFVDDERLDKLHIITLEICRFGFVNVSVGHNLGNTILVLAAKRLRKLFADAFAIGRIHGDHFALALNAQSGIEHDVAKLLKFIQRPFAVKGEAITLSVRIGAADSQSGVTSPTEMLHAAEIALHQSKSSHAKVNFFNWDMAKAARETHQLENDLRVSLVINANELHRALSNKEFYIEYQPIIDISNHTIHAFEALLRWNHPKQGRIPPDRFIPMAEEIRIMDILGGWVLRRACLDAVDWPPNEDGTYPSVCINVSETQLIEPKLFFQSLEQAIYESDIAANRIEIEITESMAAVPNARQSIKKMRQLGCKVSLDDFGTGYSSLAQLQHLPLDYVKVDKSFVKNIGDSDSPIATSSERLTRVIIAIGAAMDIEPIIEGVETLQQLDTVNQYGAKYIQGYLFSKPIPQYEVSYFISHHALQRRG